MGLSRSKAWFLRERKRGKQRVKAGFFSSYSSCLPISWSGKKKMLHRISSPLALWLAWLIQHMVSAYRWDALRIFRKNSSFNFWIDILKGTSPPEARVLWIWIGIPQLVGEKRYLLFCFSLNERVALSLLHRGGSKCSSASPLPNRFFFL